MREPVVARQAPADAVVQMHGINKWYGRYHALRDVELAVAPGERVIVCGPSGSGKSTLVRVVNLLEPFQRGGCACAASRSAPTRSRARRGSR